MLAMQISGITEHHSFRWRCKCECTTVYIIDYYLGNWSLGFGLVLCWRVLIVVELTDLFCCLVILNLHLAVKSGVKHILIVFMDLLNQIFVVNSQKVLLKQTFVVFVILNYIETLLWFEVVTYQLVFLFLLLFF